MPTCATTDTDYYGVNATPGNGANAISSGIPGAGGKGGSFLTNIQSPGDLGAIEATGGVPGLPGPAYLGGKAGTPISWTHRKHVWQGTWSTIKSGKTQPGNNSSATSASPGVNGSIQSEVSHYIWLRPDWMRVVLKHAQDSYNAQGDFSQVRTLLIGYIGRLGEYEADPTWNKLTESERAEFRAIAIDMKKLTQPSAPTKVDVKPGNENAEVTFEVPWNNGGSPIISYTVTASSGGQIATGPASPITVTKFDLYDSKMQFCASSFRKIRFRHV
jgi:hypothetical protein